MRDVRCAIPSLVNFVSIRTLPTAATSARPYTQRHTHVHGRTATRTYSSRSRHLSSLLLSRHHSLTYRKPLRLNFLSTAYRVHQLAINFSLSPPTSLSHHQRLATMTTPPHQAKIPNPWQVDWAQYGMTIPTPPATPPTTPPHSSIPPFSPDVADTFPTRQRQGRKRSAPPSETTSSRKRRRSNDGHDDSGGDGGDDGGDNSGASPHSRDPSANDRMPTELRALLQLKRDTLRQFHRDIKTVEGLTSAVEKRDAQPLAPSLATSLQTCKFETLDFQRSQRRIYDALSSHNRHLASASTSEQAQSASQAQNQAEESNCHSSTLTQQQHASLSLLQAQAKELEQKLAAEQSKVATATQRNEELGDANEKLKAERDALATSHEQMLRENEMLLIQLSEQYSFQQPFQHSFEQPPQTPQPLSLIHI